MAGLLLVGRPRALLDALLALLELLLPLEPLLVHDVGLLLRELARDLRSAARLLLRLFLALDLGESLLSRGLEVAASFAKWQLGRKRSDDDGAASLTRTLERLGPSLTKIGQALGSRPDLLPPPFVRALESLQDQVPPFDDDQARALLDGIGADVAVILAAE